MSKNNNNNNGDLEDKGYLFVSGGINENDGTKFIKKCLKISLDNSINKSTVFINSDGGNCNEAWQMVYGIELMKRSGKKVTTICCGEACSMAFIIFLTGNERYITKYSILMSHRFTGDNCRRKHPDMMSHRKEEDWLHERFVLHYMEYLGWTRKKVVDTLLTKEDQYILPNESLDLGVSTKII